MQARDNNWTKLLISYILLILLGFPGSYEFVFGHTFEMAIEYSAFIFQILIMLGTSADNIEDVRLLDMKPEYGHIYMFLAGITIVSMFGTISIPEQIISCIRVSVTAAFAIWLIEGYKIKEILETLYKSQIAYIILSIAFPIFFSTYDYRGQSYEEVFVGIGGVKNVTGAELSFSIIMMLILWRLKKKDNESVSGMFVAIMAIQAILLVITRSTGALLLTIAAAIILRCRGERRHAIGAIYIAGSIGFLATALMVINLFEPLLTSLGKDATLTGRIPLWKQIIDVMTSNRPLTGFGYGMFWRNDHALSLIRAGFDENSWYAGMHSGAHNNILELWLNTGIIGVALFFFMILAAFRNVKNISEDRYIFCLMYMFYYMTNGWLERLWTTYEYQLFFLFAAIAAAAAPRNEECKSISGNYSVQSESRGWPL